MATLKITVPLSVEVDPEKWDRAFGTGTDPASIRDDVRAYLANGLSDLDVWKEVDGVVSVKGC